MTYKINLRIPRMKELCKDVDCMLAGGSCLSEVQKTFGIRSSYDDLDFFFEDEKNFKKMVQNIDKLKKIVNTGATLMFHDISLQYETKNALTYNFFNTTIQLIKIFKPFKKTIRDFDNNNAKFYSFYPFDVVQTEQPEITLREFSTNKLSYVGVHRLCKYVTQKNINADVFVEEIIDMLNNPKEEYYAEKLYDDEKMTNKKIRLKTLYTVIDTKELQLKIQEFEKQGKKLPYYLIPKKTVTFIRSDNKAAEYLTRKNLGINQDPFVVEYVRKYLPEYIL